MPARVVSSCLRVLVLSMMVSWLPVVAAQSLTFMPTWTQQSPATSPGARSNAAMAYDAATGQLVLFGGQDSSGNFLSDTWTYDGTNWTQQSPANVPQARVNASMAYYAGTGQVVLFGGLNSTPSSLSDTWTWDGSNWTKQSPTNSPSARRSATMTPDAAGHLVLFGGNSGGPNAETWTWDGSNWTKQSPTNIPTARYFSTMGYDPATGQVVLFGGVGSGGTLSDTWTWDGSNWTNQNPTNIPPARQLSAMAYDAAAGQVVLFGGLNGNYLDDTWTWDGSNWTAQGTVRSPPVRYTGVMAYDAATAQVLLFGGYGSGNSTLNDTWALQLGAVSLGAANVCPSGASTPAPCSQSATVNFLAGAAFTDVTQVNVLTQGAPSLDFTATPSTCFGPLSAQPCMVPVKFAPTHPGLRLGAISFTDLNGNVVGSIPLSGIGNGPQVVFPSNNTPITLPSGISGSPSGVAVDGSGDVFVSYTVPAGVWEIVAVNGVVTSNSAVKTVGSGFTYPTGVAVDGNGDVFVADSIHNQLYEVVAVNGAVSSSSTVKMVGAQLGATLNGVAVDASGDVFLSYAVPAEVWEIVAVNGVITSNSTVKTVGSGFNQPKGLAVDASGDVFVADSGNKKVYEIVAVNGTVSSSSTLKTVGSGFNLPAGLAVDASGDVFVADAGNNKVYEIVAVNGAVSSSSTVTTLASGFSQPNGVALDGSGNVYIADVFHNAVKELPLATPPTVAFATTTTDGNTDTTDGTQTVTVQNDGNQPLVFTVPTTGTNPTTAPDFTFTTTSGSACPSLTTSATTTGTLAAGAICNVPLTFTPVTPASGALNESLVFTDNALNAISATQSIALTGTASLPVPTVTSISPSYGPTAGGTAVTITGTNFTNGSTVAFGSTAAASLTLNATTIRTVSPAGAGTVDVTVTTGGSTSATSANDLFTYIAPVSTANSTVVASPSPAVAGSTATVTVTLKDASGNAINGATASFSSTSTTASFGKPSVNGNVITVSMTDTAAESAPISVTLGGVVSGTLTGSAQFVAPVYVVTVATDPTSANESASHCVDPNVSTTGNANCSLREAVDAANALTGVTTNINFATPLFSSAQTILIAQSTPITINASMNINGPGANLLTVEGGTTPLSTVNYQVFLQNSGTVTLSGLTVANGNQVGFGGGGIVVAAGKLTVINSTFSGNQAQSISGNQPAFAAGGAIYSEGALTVSNSTFSGNQAATGGAIVVYSALTVSNSTFSGNQAPNVQGSHGGGAIFAVGSLTVSNSTFSGNQAPNNRGGGIVALDTLTVTNSIFSGDSAGTGSGIFTNNGGTVTNIVNNGDTFSGVTPANAITADPKLSPLGSYGGPTQTLLPLPGSAAICAGTQPKLNNTPLTTDQRGVAISATRYGQAACYDIGAVQTEYAMTGPLTVPSLVTPVTAVSPAPTVSLTEDGAPFTAGAATVTLSDTQNDLSSGSSASNSLTTGVVTFGSVQFSTAEASDTLTATLSLNPAMPVSLTVTSNSFQVGQLTPVLAFAPAPNSQTYGTAIAAGSLDATASYGGNAVAGTFSYTATSNTTSQSTALTAGSTLLPADTYTLTATFTPANTTLYKSGLTVQAGYTVVKATPTVSLMPSVSAVLAQNPVTLTATVSSPASTPTRNVTFLDGNVPLGTFPLNAGVASLTTSSLSVGTHSITAMYSGDNNFSTLTSGATNVVVSDFTLSFPGTGSQTILPGGTASYGFTLSPLGSATLPSAVALGVSGLPAGATYTFNPGAMVAAGAGSTTLTLAITVPQQKAMLHRPSKLLPVSMATLLLLPFAGTLRRRAGTLSRLCAMLLLLAGGAAGISTLTGCGAQNGFFDQPQQSYQVTINASSGALTHTTTVTLTVQ